MMKYAYVNGIVLDGTMEMEPKTDVVVLPFSSFSAKPESVFPAYDAPPFRDTNYK